MFAMDRGEELWNAIDEQLGLSCASCHEDAAVNMAGVAARYPQYDETFDGIVNLELRINEMRSEHIKAAPYPNESEDMLALTTHVTFQSRGVPMNVDVSGNARPYFEKGRAFFSSAAAGSTSPVTSATTNSTGRCCAGIASARARSTASLSTGSAGAQLDPATACSDGATPLSDPSHTRSALRNT